jgi:thiol-disulfide isomerase/thioredoxin
MIRTSARHSAVAVCLLLTSYAPAAEPEQNATHALLINGGSRPSANYQSHLHHLEDMVALLERRGISRERTHVFSADGEDEAADLAVRDAQAAGFWVLDGTRLGGRLRRTDVTNTIWEGMTLRPSTGEALREWFETAAQTLAPGDRLLIFVTDHGTGNDEDPNNGAISMWKEELTVLELKELISQLEPGVRSVMVMSQCYSGTFADAIYRDASSDPSGDVCGFFSTARDLRAYGCYPEGRDRDRIGHAFRFIDALDRNETTAEAHLEVLVTDSTPDAPLRTSDVYLDRLLAEEAETLGLQYDALVDRLLAEAWSDRAVWEKEIRLLDRIGDAFGIFSPRRVAELAAYERDLPELSERMKTYADRWRATAVNVKEENLRSFARERPEWKERLETEAIKKLDIEGRRELLAELLPELEKHARDQPETMQRLDRLGDLARKASEAEWRLEVRRAAMRRLRSILTGIAGRVLLETEMQAEETGTETAATVAERRVAQRRALTALESCEAFEPGLLDAGEMATRDYSIEPFPKLEEDLRLLEEVLPSWLGVRFRSVPSPMREDRELPKGASYLQAVYPDSPALEAGLEVGDIVLGPPEKLFSAPQQIREWTMLSPRDTPLPIRVLRPGDSVEDDLEFETTLELTTFPLEIPELPAPPQVGDAAPALPSGLELVGSAKLPEFNGGPRLLFFWATWCKPCKRAVPEVLAFAESEKLQVVAISDEEGETVSNYLDTRVEPFFDQAAVDPYRRSFISYGVSGTPTMVLVDAEGVIVHRQVGYNAADGLTVEGWSWESPAEPAPKVKGKVKLVPRVPGE